MRRDSDDGLRAAEKCLACDNIGGCRARKIELGGERKRHGRDTGGLQPGVEVGEVEMWGKVGEQGGWRDKFVVVVR